MLFLMSCLCKELLFRSCLLILLFSLKTFDLNVVQLKKHLDDLQASAGDTQSAVSRLQQENSALDEEKRNLRNSLLSEQGKRQQLAEDLAKVSTAAGRHNSPSSFI